MSRRILPRSAGDGDEVVDDLLEHRERDVAGLEDEVVEFLERKFRAERLLGFGAEFEDPEHADLVGAGLARVHDVAFHLRGGDAVVDRLLAGPVLGVQAGVGHEAPGAEELPMELAQPSLGIAPLLVQTIFEKIVEINRERGITILLVEQNANLALEISRYGYVLETGRILLEDNSAALRENPQVKSAYLGG